MMSINDYTPEIVVGRYAKFLVALDKCIKCGRYMVARTLKGAYPFPTHRDLVLESQAKRANIAMRSSIMVDGEYICEDCAKEGKADFLCALCKERKGTDKIKESIGDPPEFLCTDCYETVPARIWDEKAEDLFKSHRYDYE